MTRIKEAFDLERAAAGRDDPLPALACHHGGVRFGVVVALRSIRGITSLLLSLLLSPAVAAPAGPQTYIEQVARKLRRRSPPIGTTAPNPRPTTRTSRNVPGAGSA